MTPSQIYVAVMIVTLAIIAFLMGNKNQKTKRLSRTSAVAFGFMLAGIIFGENRLIGYGLIAIGLILSVVDIYLKSKQ